MDVNAEDQALVEQGAGMLRDIVEGPVSVNIKSRDNLMEMFGDEPDGVDFVLSLPGR